MATEPEDVMELRFFGEGIKPETVKASELAKLITSLENSILSTVSAQNPEINLNDVYISLVSIKNESEGLKFVPNLKDIVVPAFLTITQSISSGDFDRLTSTAINDLAPIQSFIVERRCGVEFKLDNHVLASVDPNSDFQWRKTAQTENKYIYGETDIYAYVQRAGGKVPKVWLKVDGRTDPLYIETSEIIARRLAAMLYETVGLSGTAKWEVGTYKLVDFKINKILNFTPTAINEAFEDLSKDLGKYWNEIDNIDDALFRSSSIDG